ncbi:MAG: PIN domain-containing protein [Candidatus Eisenbacteria bacterium]
MRIIADTNIHLSTLLFGGPPEGIIGLARQGTIQLVVSPGIMLEIAMVLKSKFDWHEADVADVICYSLHAGSPDSGYVCERPNRDYLSRFDCGLILS